jgi:hypothetical protein
VTAWQTLLTYGTSVLFGIITNFFIAAFYAGRYKERVERLTKEINNYESRLQRLEQAFSALTGQAGGITYRQRGNTTKEG